MTLPRPGPVRIIPPHQAIREIYSAVLEPARWPEALQADRRRFCGCRLDPDLRPRRCDIRRRLLAKPRTLCRRICGRLERPRYARKSRQRARLFVRPRRLHGSGHHHARRNGYGPVLQRFPAQARLALFRPRHGLARSAHLGRVEHSAPARQAGIFRNQELEIAGELGAHVEQALRLSIRLMNAELINAGLGAALARLGIGVFALNSMSRIVFSNPAAEALLGDGPSTLSTGGCAPSSALSGRMNSEIARAIANSNDPAGKPVPLIIERKPIAPPARAGSGREARAYRWKRRGPFRDGCSRRSASRARAQPAALLTRLVLR